MAIVLPEDMWPSIVIGRAYLLKPTQTGGQWVKVLSIDDGIVHAVGVWGNIADLHLPMERFYNALAYTGTSVPG